jgi:hypothetical protein
MSSIAKNPSCIGWTNPNNLYYGPIINSLSSYYSPAASTSLVVITGQNFYSWSTVKFGTFFPTVYFINSNILEFYVPTSAAPGSYPVQVFNGSVVSNIEVYIIDNASGYWILNPDGSISPSVTNGITVSQVNIEENLVMSGIAGVNYIEFPDGTKQYTAFQEGILDIYTFPFTGITQSASTSVNNQIVSFGSPNPIPPSGTYLITGSILMSGNANGGYTISLLYGISPTLIQIIQQIGNTYTSNICNPIGYNLSQITTIDGTGTELYLQITTGTITSGNFSFSGTINFTRLQ